MLRNPALGDLAEPSGSCTSTPTSRCTTFTYNNDDQRTQTTYPNGVTQTMTYDAADRLSEIKATKALTTLTDFTYDWICGGTTDKALRCASTATLNGGATTSTAYSYDALGRLTSSNTGSGTDVYSYAHDNAGNLTSQTHNTSTTSYGYDASNELCWRIAGTQAGSSCTAPTGATTYAFDANGNQLSSSDGRSFAYNPRNQTTDLTPVGGYDRQATYAGPDQNEMTNGALPVGVDSSGRGLWPRRRAAPIGPNSAGSESTRSSPASTAVAKQIDTPQQRAHLADAIVQLRHQRRIDRRQAAYALIDLDSRSTRFIGASLLEAVAVSVGVSRTPGGLHLAA